jgi:hypothetical protein
MTGGWMIQLAKRMSMGFVTGDLLLMRVRVCSFRYYKPALGHTQSRMLWFLERSPSSTNEECLESVHRMSSSYVD